MDIDDVVIYKYIAGRRSTADYGYPEMVYMIFTT